MRVHTPSSLEEHARRPVSWPILDHVTGSTGLNFTCNCDLAYVLWLALIYKLVTLSSQSINVISCKFKTKNKHGSTKETGPKLLK